MADDDDERENSYDRYNSFSYDDFQNQGENDAEDTDNSYDPQHTQNQQYNPQISNYRTNITSLTSTSSYEGNYPFVNTNIRFFIHLISIPKRLL